METFPVPVEQFQHFLLCLARTAAILSAIPGFGSVQTPDSIKIGLSLLFSLALFPVASQYIQIQNPSSIALIVLLAGEVLLGAMLGLIVRLIFVAVEFGATIVGFQMGFATANVFDPQHQNQLSVLSQFMNIFSLLIFFSLNIHHLFFDAFVSSFRLLPPGSLDFTGNAALFLLSLTSRMFILSIQFSAPVLAVLLLSGLALGLMARVFPQLNVFLLSFPLNIGLAFFIIGVTLNLTVSLLTREFAALPEQFNQTFQILRTK